MSTKLVAVATSLERSKKWPNFRSFICGQSSTKPANFAEIDPVDVETVALTERNH